MRYKHYIAMYFSPVRLEFHIVLGVSFHLNCMSVFDIIDGIADIIRFVGTHVNSQTLKTDMNNLKNTAGKLCSRRQELSISIAFLNGDIDATKTYIGYNSHKLYLSDLPICPSVNGIPPSSKSIHHLFHTPESKCSKNADCWSDKGKYNDGYTKMRHGYCLNHNTWKTSVGCSGRCIKKLRSGESCSARRLNLPFWKHNGPQHAACQSGACLCETCAEMSNKKLRNYKKCSSHSDCKSGWCEGSKTSSCAGLCKPKRKALATAWCDFSKCSDASCVTGKVICKKCANTNGKVPNGYTCSGNSDCESGWCDGNRTGGCSGKCKTKGRNEDNICRMLGCGFCSRHHRDPFCDYWNCCPKRGYEKP